MILIIIITIILQPNYRHHFKKNSELTRLSTGGSPPSESGSFFTVLASGLLSQSYSISGTNRSRQKEQNHSPLKRDNPKTQYKSLQAGTYINKCVMLLSDENLTPKCENNLSKTALFLIAEGGFSFHRRPYFLDSSINMKITRVMWFSSETINKYVSPVRACLGDLRRAGTWHERWKALGHLSQHSSSPPVWHAAHKPSLESSSGARCWSTCWSPPSERMWLGVLLWSCGLLGGRDGLWGLSSVLWRGVGTL